MSSNDRQLAVQASAPNVGASLGKANPSKSWQGRLFSYFHSWRCCGCVISCICALYLAKVGMQTYSQTKVVGPAFTFSGVFCVIGVVLGILEIIERRFDLSSATRRITGSSLLEGVRSDCATVEGACSILGVSVEQVSDQTLLEQKKKTILADLNKTLEQLQKTGASTSPLIESTNIRMGDVEKAYQTLTRTSQ